MTKLSSLSRSPLLALPFALLLAACGGEAGAPEPASNAAVNHGDPSAEVETTVTEDDGDRIGPNDPVTVVNGAEAPADEAPNAKSGGSERDDRGFAEMVGISTEELNAEPPVDDDVDTGIAQSSDPLTATRGATLFNEAKRNTSWLKESTSYYSHDTYMNESTGTRRTDCSGLTGYALTRVLRDAFDKIPHPGRSKPLAEDYYNYFASRYSSATSSYSSTPRWRKMLQVKNLKPGDMVVWLAPYPSENTGHIMVVRDYPRPGRTSRDEWLVPIIDSTGSPHSYNGAWDSRGTTRDGVGSGTIGLKVNSEGQPRAYYWTGGKSGTPVYTKIAMARVE